MPKPAKLTWWQKFLKAIGLYKEPVKPARKPRAKPNEAKTAPKSNTRVARTAKSDHAAAPDGERRPRKSRERSERSERSGRSEKRSGGDPDSVESSRIYVGNLSYDVTEQDLKELFKGIGSVRNVEVVYDRKTHRSKGFGFVEMIHVDEAKRAVEVLHDQFFMGREMVVSGAKKKGQDEREDQEESREETPKPVELAPLPPAAAIEPDPTEKAAQAADDTPAPAASSDIVTPVVEETLADAPEADAPEAGESDAGKKESAKSDQEPRWPDA